MDSRQKMNVYALQRTACLVFSSLLLNIVLSGVSFGDTAKAKNEQMSEFLRRQGGLIGQTSNTVLNLKDSWNEGLKFGEFFSRVPLMSPIMGGLGGSALFFLTLITDPNVKDINKSIEGVNTASSNFGWGVANLFGFYKIPKGLVQVHAKSKKHPDGAQPFSSLTFDHTDEAKLHVESTVRSIRQGDPLRNAIFYGDAGTGKSAVARSFAHLKGFKVYSVSGHRMGLSPPRGDRKNKEDASFSEITEWLKRASNKNNKIILDISEGDSLLAKIAHNDHFHNFFKKNYESSQENFALFFSCNFNADVGGALKKISETSELDRRFKDRINFKTPSAKVRMLLLKNSITDTIISLSSKKTIEDKSIFFEVNDFFDSIFSNRQLIKGDFVTNTENYSHDHMIKLGQKLVQVYVIARLDELRGVDPRLTEFDYIDDMESKYAQPLDQVLAVLRRPYGDSEWVQNKTEEFIEKQHQDTVKQIPLMKKQQEYNNLQRALQSGNFNFDENGNPISMDNQYGGQRGGPFGGYGGQYGDRFGRGNGFEYDQQAFSQ